MSISCLHRWVAVILFCITSFGGYFSMDILSPLQSQLMVDVGIDEVYFLGLHTAYNWSYCIFSLLGGPLLSRITTRTGFIICAEGIKVNSSGKTNRASAENKMRLKDLLQFPIQFWLLVFVTPFCYSTVNCVVAVIVDFLKTEFDVSSFTAGLYSSIIYLVSLVGCSISGAVADYFGCRLTLLLLSAIFLCAFISFLALSNVLPVIPLVFGGLSYSIYASLIWSFVPIILPSHCAATGNALLSFSSSFVSGILSLVIGAIIREMGYRSALMTTLITSSLCFLLVLVMKWIDKGNKSALDALNLRCYKKVVDN
eukprot:MONOS_11063.1-p1 / transcript=MONOS_11063.1 / gene=MONOS_11063 / organism=Monocercomonoides_exilis_PA203 / gene_product=unspecified product / transcript_product=unspecified product / location=Mono_scaffold00534:3227-5303(+) / protein_length=311 / sequence_SO=supercontig / SO=protein_coding / is_pseudo=false